MVQLAVFLTLLAAPEPERPATVRILFTSDLHCRTLPSPDFDAPGMPRRRLGGWHGLVRTIDSLRTGATVLVDCGDFAFGSPEGDSLDGRAAVRFLSQLRYDAAAIGARDLVAGLENLEYIAAGAGFSLLGDPLLDVALNRRVPLFRPFKVVQAGGLRLAVVGLIDPTTPEVYATEELRGLAVETPLIQIGRYLPLVRAESCDVGIVIGQITPADGRAIADSFPELAAVLCRAGAEPTMLSVRDGGPVVAAGRFGQRVGVLDIEFDRKSRSVVRAELQHANVLPQSTASDPMWAWVDELDRVEWRQPAALSTAEFPPWSGGQPGFALAAAELVRRQSGADIALIPPDAFEPGLEAGRLDRRAVLAAAPYRDRLRMVTVSDSGLALLALSPNVSTGCPAPAIAGGDYFVASDTGGWPRARSIVRIRVREPRRGNYKVVVTARWIEKTLLRDRGRLLGADLRSTLVAALGERDTLRPAAPVRRYPATAGLVRAAGNGLVNLNTAGVDELCTLPGIGPKTAERIIEHRGAVGRFGSVDDLDRVKGIGPKKMERIRPLVTVR